MSKIKFYLAYGNERKTKRINILAVCTSPKGGPYPVVWFTLGERVPTALWDISSEHIGAPSLNTTAEKVHPRYLHRRCHPLTITLRDVEEFRPDLLDALEKVGYVNQFKENRQVFSQESPIKVEVGATYNPDARE